MEGSETIRYIENSKINRKKWDICIKEAINIELVAFSWFLDSVCDDWDALILGDYKAVMPLPFTRQGRLQVLKQPILTKHLGIYSTFFFDDFLAQRFISAIPPKFQSCNIGLSPFTPTQLPTVDYTKRVYEIDLISGFTSIKQQFSTDGLKRIEHAKKTGLRVKWELQPQKFLELLKKAPFKGSKNYNEQSLNRLSSVISSALRYGLGEIIAVYSPNKKLCAAGFFLSYINQSVLMACATTNAGKTKRADYLITYEYIKKKSFKPETLSFYLDNYPRHDRIAEHFGALPVTYGKFRRNSMSLWQRLMSRF